MAPAEPAEPWDYCRSAVVAHCAWPDAFLESGKTHVAVLGVFVGGHGLKRFGRLQKLMWLLRAPGALNYCTGWAWLKCVLGGCEKAGGWLGPLELWVAVGLLSWCTGHGLNAFWEAVKTYVAVWGPWSLGLQICCPGALGIGLNAFWESGKTHVAVLGPFVPWTGWAWLKCVLEAVKNAGWPFGACGARGALGLL